MERHGPGPCECRAEGPDAAVEALTETSPDLGSRAILDEAKELFWYPSEVDVSIRRAGSTTPPEDEKVRSLEALKEIYFASVGSNSVLLLNVPPDRRGRIHENDARRLHEFGEWLRRSFARNLAAGGDTLWTAGRAKRGNST